MCGGGSGNGPAGRRRPGHDKLSLEEEKKKGFVRLQLKGKNCVIALLGSAILAFGLYHVHSFAGVTEGGVLGMTLLLHHWLHLSPAVSGLVLNFLCYLLGWRLLGRTFILYSIVAGGGFSIFYAFFERFPPLWPELAEMLWFIVLFLVLQQVEGNLIYPRVVGSSVGLPPIWVLVAVTVGGSTSGVVGMLLFIPTSSVIYALLRENVRRRIGERSRRQAPPRAR